MPDRQPIARTMAAYRASTCPCGQPIAVGDRIALIRGRWRCDEVCNRTERGTDA